MDEGFLPLIREKARAAGVTNAQTVLGIFTDPKLPAAVDVGVHPRRPASHRRSGGVFQDAGGVSEAGRALAIIDFHPAKSPHQDQPALQAAKAETQAMLAELGFKPIADIAVFEDKWFVVFSRSP